MGHVGGVKDVKEEIKGEAGPLKMEGEKNQRNEKTRKREKGRKTRK